MEIHPTEMSQGENDYEKDLQRLTSTIAGKIGEGVQKIESFFSSACIYRVSEDLRKLKESAYTPRLIAIGPLHREDKHLQTPLQYIKMSYTNYLLSRLTARMEDPALAEQTKFTVLQKCLAEMKTLVDDAKKCYAEEVTLDEEMMLVDGCFILEFLYMYRSRRQLYGDSMATQRKLDGDSKGQKTDPIFGNSLTLVFVRSDLVILENQIPFFVLEKLFKLTLGRIPNRPDESWSLSDYVWSCYGVTMSPVGNSTNAMPWCSPSDCVLSVFGNKSTTNEEEDRNAKYYHILHNIHYGCLPRDQTKQKQEPSEKVVLMPSASELAYAGVMFVPDESGNDLFKFKFREPKGLFWWCLRACFVMPPLDIYESTETVLRNLIALEQSCPAVSQHVSSYACVMDMLVNSNKDVQVLEKAGVIRNYLGAVEDATDLFNNLCKEIYFGDYFAETCIKATRYSKCFWPKNMAHLRRTYFASPWTFIAFCVGFIAFIMSFLQFVRDFHKKNG